MMIFITVLAAIASAEMCCKNSHVDMMGTADEKNKCSCSKHTTNCANTMITNLTCTFPDDVKIIFLNHNRLQRIDCSYAWPGSLEYLDLSYNKISDFCFNESLKSLKYLDMRWNPINYSFSDDVFKPLLSLKTLKLKQYITHNHPPCSGIPSVMNFEALTVLHNLTNLTIDLSPNIKFALNFSKLEDFINLDMSCDLSTDSERKIFCLHNPKCCPQIINEDMFSNLIFLTNLSITDCDLRLIEKGAFSAMSRLKYLNISNNIHLTFSPLQNLTWNLNNTRIEILDLSKLHCPFGMSTELCELDFVGLQNTNLKQLYLDSNNIRRMNKNSISHIPTSLQKFSLKDNDLVLGVYSTWYEHLTNLTELDVSRVLGVKLQDMSAVFIECPDYFRINCSVNTVKSIEKNNFKNNMSINPSYFPFAIPPNLKLLKASNIPMNMEIGNLQFAEPNKLEYLILSLDFFLSWTGPVGPFMNLKFLDLSNNYCQRIGPNFFQKMRNIKELHIQRNILGANISEDWFKYLRKLEILNISSNLLPSLPKDIFKNQKSMRILDISENNLKKFHVNFQHMKNLELLLLLRNDISNLSNEFMNSVDSIRKKNKKLQVDLSQNPLDCSCKTLNGLQWIQNWQHVFKNFNNYVCIYVNKTQGSFRNINLIIAELEKSCSNYSTVLLLTLFFVSLFVALIVFMFVFRYRWKIRYLYHMFRAKDKKNKQTLNDFKYDAFISYAEEQSKFVTVDMIQHLELEFGLRLCLHQRDFVPGKSIATNITSSVHQSQRTVLVLSQAFVESYWCMFEFQMAKMEGMYARSTDNIIFVIIYEHVPMNKLPLNLLNVISNQSFIEFPGDEQGNIVFWNKLGDALKT